MWAIGALLIMTASCSDNKEEKSREALIEEVERFEDSLKLNTTTAASGSEISMRYAEKCLAVYREYPKSEEAPAYLDKAHLILSSAGMYRLAAQYGDTLIRKYPAYENRPMVLQNLASAYDMSIVPRRKDLVEKYYRLLLKENKNLPAEERESIQYRLDHIDLTFEELIVQRQKDLAANR
jgi:tetratricopeptide (TPR) repeat protein